MASSWLTAIYLLYLEQNLHNTGDCLCSTKTNLL